MMLYSWKKNGRASWKNLKRNTPGTSIVRAEAYRLWNSRKTTFFKASCQQYFWRDNVKLDWFSGVHIIKYPGFAFFPAFLTLKTSVKMAWYVSSLPRDLLETFQLNIAFQVPLASKWWWNMALYHIGIRDCVIITFMWYCRLGVELGASQEKQRNLASWHERCDILYGWVNDKYVRLRSRPTSPESSFGGIKRQQSVIEVRLYVNCEEQIFFQWTPNLTTKEFTFCCFPEVK